MQEYLHCLVRLRARAPDVAEKTIIEAAIAGLSLGPCREYLERRKPKTLNRLFEIMQEYCISDKGKRRRIEEMNEKRSRNRDREKPYQAEQAKTPKAVNTVSGDEARGSRPQDNRGGRSDRSKSNRGRKENSGRRQKVPYCCIRGKDNGHWTSDCPLVKEKKEEFDRSTSTQPPKPVNYTHTNQPRGPPQQIQW